MFLPRHFNFPTLRTPLLKQIENIFLFKYLLIYKNVINYNQHTIHNWGGYILAKGRPKQFEKMIAYNTRLQAETKLQADALVATSTKFEGQRELFEEMLRLYKQAYPDHYAKAEKYRELLKED